MTRPYHFKRPYVRQIPMFKLPEGEDTEESRMLAEVDEAEAELTAQRKVIAVYEKRAKEAQQLYDRLNYGKAKRKRTRGGWYR